MNKQEWLCLIAGMCVVAVVLLFGGWLIYLACMAVPRLCDVLPKLGFILMGFAIQMVWSEYRRRGARHDAD